MDGNIVLESGSDAYVTLDGESHSLAAVFSTIQKLLARVGSLETANAALEARLDTKTNPRVTALEEEIKLLQAANTALEARLDTETNLRVTTLDEQVKLLQAADTELKSRLDTETNPRVIALDKQVKLLQEKVDDANTGVAAVHTKIIATDKDVDALSALITTNTGKVGGIPMLHSVGHGMWPSLL